MSLQIFVVHIGERLSADPASFPTSDAFRSWLATVSSVPPSFQILLTATGKQAKFNTLHHESEVFLYNRQLLFTTAEESVNLTTLPSVPITPLDSAPDTLADQNALDSWKQLFRARRTWVLDLVDKAGALHSQLESHADAISLMSRGVNVAIGNLDSHIANLEQRHGEAKEWADGVVQEQEEALAMVPSMQSQMRKLPGDKKFTSLIPLLANQPILIASNTLDGFFDSQLLEKASHDVKMQVSDFARETSELSHKVQAVVHDAAALFDSVAGTNPGPVGDLTKNASQLFEEIQVLSNKVASDCDHVSSLPTAQRSISQASKMALPHTKEYLPALRDYYQEMGDSLNKTIAARNTAIEETSNRMRKVADLESAFASADKHVKCLNFAPKDESAVSMISLMTQFPFVYGALLLESVRRREWSEKLRAESATLAEDIAGYREEEERRRKKWAKQISGVISDEAANGKVLDFELNLRADDSAWPDVTRDSIASYIESLAALGESQRETVDELRAGFQDLDRPTKRQLKMAKNFKAGSAHEAFSGKGSFLFRENDELKALRESNSRLDDEVKSQKSRVRKLEDLLYRQTQGRTISGNNLFQGPDSSPQQPSTPEANSPSIRESLSRQTSHTSRRASANRSNEEKALARRIVSLEAELHQEKHKRQDLEAAASGRSDTSARMRSELEDTRSTKRDLMANLEAQQREFLAERRHLEENISKHKVRVEELEDELEKIIGSRDNSRVIGEEKARGLEVELEMANKSLESLRSDIKRIEEARDENARSLRGIFSHLCPEQNAPIKLEELINGLEEHVERTTRQMRDLNHSITTAKSEKEELEMVLERKEKDALEAKDTIQSLEHEMSALKGDLSTERARATSLNEELDDGRKQLRDLRAKFAEGETGSEALRLRVEEQASRASDLAADLARSKSHVNSLDVELSSLQRKHASTSKQFETTSQSLERRSAKSKELTYRLAAYHQELVRLLDALNLSVMRKDGALFIQRSSKLANQSAATLPDAGGSIAVLGPYEPFDTTIAPSLLAWMHTDNMKDENDKFTELLARVDDFNLTTFSEAVIKLRRDVEWTGKKWKMEARNYRDKYHRAQSEGQDKIAFRSFKEGDLALFLPTRNQATRPWAAFNVGAPHYFLREKDTHHLRNREWLVARIQKIDERVVDLSKNLSDSLRIGDRPSVGETSEGGSLMDDDNPFELSDGLRWYLLDAAEDKPGAPSTPGLGKSTVASVNVAARGDFEKTKPKSGNDASKKLNKSLESRRSSSNSKRGSISGGIAPGRDHADAVAPSSPTVAEHCDAQGQKVPIRPGSRSSTNGPRPSGLGVEVTRDGARGANDEHLRDPAKALAATSPPAAGLLGLFGSPPRTWLRRTDSHASRASQEDPKSRSSPQPHEQSTSQQQQQQQQQQRNPNKPLGPTSPQLRPTSSRGQSRGGADNSHSKSPSRTKQGGGGWESLWSLDLNLEEKGKGRSSGA